MVTHPKVNDAVNSTFLHYRKMHNDLELQRQIRAAGDPTVTVTVRTWEGYSSAFPDTLDEMIAELQTAREEIPEEYRASAAFNCESSNDGFDSYSIEASITYKRKKTAEEKEADAKLLAQAQAAERDMREKRERAEFERLKAKFG